MITVDDSELYSGIGACVKAYRLSKQWTQQELAHRVGFLRTSIANIEGGVQRTPLHTLLIFARALDVPLINLLPTMCHPQSTDTVSPHELLLAQQKNVELEQRLERIWLICEEGHAS